MPLKLAVGCRVILIHNFDTYVKTLVHVEQSYIGIHHRILSFCMTGPGFSLVKGPTLTINSPRDGQAR
jgi:hypothetical protein